MRRHGWQQPFHPLQVVGMIIYIFLVVTFYAFLGFFLGNVTAEVTVTSVYTAMASLVMFLFVRCTAIDPTDKTQLRKKRKSKSNRLLKLNYGFVLSQTTLRFFRKVERYIMKAFIKRKYAVLWSASFHHEDPLPFPLLLKDDMMTPDLKADDMSFCVLCNLEVKKNSKHCMTCDRCVEGFDHHCRWLNNCVGKRNYTTFFLLMISVLLMMIIQGGTAVAIFARCFADKSGIELELQRKLGVKLPSGLMASISAVLVFLIAYGSAAMGQLFIFHLVLIHKGIRTYDYIMAKREDLRSSSWNSDSSSSFSSDYGTDSDASESGTYRLRNSTNNDTGQATSGDPDSGSVRSLGVHKHGINPWELMKMSKERALAASERARDKRAQCMKKVENDDDVRRLKPMPLEMKSGPLAISSFRDADVTSVVISSYSSPVNLSPSPGNFLSPRRRSSVPSAITLKGALTPTP